MAKPEFKIKIDGHGVSPETVQWPDLREIIGGIYDAIIATARASGVPKDDIQFALVDVVESSDTLEFVTDTATHLACQPLILAVSNRDDSGISHEAREGLERSHRRLQKKSWTATISRNGASNTRAIIRPESPLFDPPKDALRGGTTLLVDVLRVGGIKPTAFVRIPSGEKLTAQVASKELAAALAAHLYQTVQVHCVATWGITTGQIRAIRITGIGNYFPAKANPSGALKELRILSGGYWDTISPTDFINDIRGQ
jgi:hypothetical protein